MSTPHTHGVIPVFFPRLVCDDLHSVELKDRAGDSLTGGDVEDAGHACFCGEGARADGDGVGLLQAG